MIGKLISATMLTGSLAAGAQGFAYEVSTVRLNTSADGGTSINRNNNSYAAINQPLIGIIQGAFNLQTADQVVGLPAWAATLRYDIIAKLDEDTASRLKTLKLEARAAAEQQPMQSLLAERFGFKFHHETRELPEYALVQAKTGARLKLSDRASPKAGNMSMSLGRIEAYSFEIRQLAYVLCSMVHRPVVDRTGLAGKYDLALEWTWNDMANPSSDGTSERAPSLFTALQEQMGLKLESIKGPVDTIVIDHIEQPTAN